MQYYLDIHEFKISGILFFGDRKTVRATLVLLPLFGLHFLVTIYRPPPSTGVCLWTEIYLYFNDILEGIQGFMVALIFCYFNGEVSSLLRRTYVRWKDQHFGRRGLGPGGGHTNSGRRGRGGSMGKSVVTTQVYSSVPPSPETNCMSVMDVGVGAGNGLTPTLGSNNLLTVAVNGTNGGSNGNKHLMVTSTVDKNQGLESSSV